MHQLRRTLGRRSETMALAVVACLAAIPAGTASATTTYTTHRVSGIQYVVGCMSPQRCVIAGYNTKGVGDLIVVNNGVPGHVSVVPTSQGIDAISCPNATGCVALVRPKDDLGTELVTLNAAGIPGKPVNYPTPSGAVLERIACVSLRSCTLAGNDIFTTPDSIEVATWNGAKMTFHRIPGLAKTTDTIIEGVACVASTCDVVGYFERTARIIGISLVVHGGAAFKLHTISNFSLYGVSCTSPARCYADGFATNGGVFVTLTNGALTSSTVVKTVGFYGVACRNTTCVAVGQENAQPPSTDFNWGVVADVTNGKMGTPFAIMAANSFNEVAISGATTAIIGSAQKAASLVAVS